MGLLQCIILVGMFCCSVWYSHSLRVSAFPNTAMHPLCITNFLLAFFSIYQYHSASCRCSSNILITITWNPNCVHNNSFRVRVTRGAYVVSDNRGGRLARKIFPTVSQNGKYQILMSGISPVTTALLKMSTNKIQPSVKEAYQTLLLLFSTEKIVLLCASYFRFIV